MFALHVTTPVSIPGILYSYPSPPEVIHKWKALLSVVSKPRKNIYIYIYDYVYIKQIFAIPSHSVRQSHVDFKV